MPRATARFGIHDFTSTLLSRLDMTYDSLRIEPGSRCIRLLRVHPTVSSQDEEGPIRGDLFVAGLETKPSFNALSYVWGVPTPDPPKVYCGDFEIPVTANGYSALVHLRRKLGGFTIWMDAVCISK